MKFEIREWVVVSNPGDSDSAEYADEVGQITYVPTNEEDFYEVTFDTYGETEVYEFYEEELERYEERLY